MFEQMCEKAKKCARECETKKTYHHPEIIHDFTFYWMMRWYISKSNAFLEQKKIKKGIKKWNHLYTKIVSEVHLMGFLLSL